MMEQPSDSQSGEYPKSSNPSDAPSRSRGKINPFLQYSGLGLQMLLTIGAGVWLGSWLDKRQSNHTPGWTLALALISIGASIYLLIRGLPKQS